MAQPIKRLARNTQAGKIAGIAAGFADYFEVDVVLMRVLFVIVDILTGVFPGVLAYVVLWFIIPTREQVAAQERSLPPTG